MGISKRVKPSEGTTDLDMTALIDVVFLLIIFFMLACRLKDSLTNATINLPKSTIASPDQPVADLFVINIESATQINNGLAKVKIKGEELTVAPIYWANGKLDRTKYSRKDLQWHLFFYIDGLRDDYNGKPNEKSIETVSKHGVVKLRIDQNTEFQHIKQVQDLLNKCGILNIAYGADLKM